MNIIKDAPGIIDKEYSDKENLMHIVANDACNALFHDTNPDLIKVFRKFVENLPHSHDESVIKISNDFWMRKTVSPRSEGAHWDISSALKGGDGNVRAAYIMVYMSKIVEKWDLLFLDYIYTKVDVKVNGIGMLFDISTWKLHKDRIKTELGPENLSSIKTTDYAFA